MWAEASAVVFDPGESESGHAVVFFMERWEKGGRREEFWSCAAFQWHQGAGNGGAAQAALRGVNEPFDGEQSATGVSTERWSGRRGWGRRRGGPPVFVVTLGLLKDLRGPS